MIATIRQKLVEMGKTACIAETLHGQEKGKSVTLNPRGEAIKLKADGCLISGTTKRCDCIYFYQHTNGKRYVFLVEMKGNNYQHALQQLSATMQHQNYKALKEIADTRHEYAVAIVSKSANINRPDKEEWERQHHIRLRVLPCDDNQKVDLVEEIIKN